MNWLINLKRRRCEIQKHYFDSRIFAVGAAWISTVCSRFEKIECSILYSFRYSMKRWIVIYHGLFPPNTHICIFGAVSRLGVAQNIRAVDYSKWLFLSELSDFICLSSVVGLYMCHFQKPKIYPSNDQKYRESFPSPKTTDRFFSTVLIRCFVRKSIPCILYFWTTDYCTSSHLDIFWPLGEPYLWSEALRSFSSIQPAAGKHRKARHCKEKQTKERNEKESNRTIFFCLAAWSHLS